LIEYEKFLNNLSSDFENEGWGDFDDDEYRKQITTMLLDVRELISIYKGLSLGKYSKTLDEDVKHYIKGPFHATDENLRTSSNRPRNVGFELYLTSIFSKAGFDPIYDTKADLSFNVKNTRFFVEAKRPVSMKNIPNLINDQTILPFIFGHFSVTLAGHFCGFVLIVEV